MAGPGFFNRAALLFALIISSSAGADALDDIIDRGTLRVGVAEFAPWTIKKESGDLIGFEIDVAKKVAGDMGVRPDFRVYEWEAIIPALQKGEIDIIAGGMSITPERALRVNFTRPLAENGVGLATNTGMTQHIDTLAELNDPKIIVACVSETLGHNVSQRLFDRADIRVFATAAEAEKEVVEGRAHVYLATMTEARFLALRNADKVDLPIAEPLIGASEALAVRKGEQELLNFLNAWVTARQSDRWIPTTRGYWFDSLDWMAAASE